MTGIASAVLSVTSHRQEDVNPQNPDDFIDADGLLRCAVCGQRKQMHIWLLGREHVVPVVCQCMAAEIQRQKDADDARQRMYAIETLHRTSLMSDALRNANFANYEHRPENETVFTIAKNYADRFDTMYEENQGLLLYGPVGTGKSYTAACIANQLLDSNVSVVMTSFVKILQEIGRIDEGEYIGKLDNARLLIVDDLGAERSTDFALEKVYNVIDSRVRSRKPMILTTNLNLNAMKSEQDMRYKRIYDRIFECCYPLYLTGRSFRLDEGNKRFLRMQELLQGKD